MRPEDFNMGFLSGLVGDYFREEPEGYERGVEMLHDWLNHQREDAHLEALDGVVSQLRMREDFLATTGQDDPFVAGYREARYKVQHVRGTLSATYKNRRRFEARDRAAASEKGQEE